MYWRRSFVYEVATQQSQSADINKLMYKFMWYDTHTTIYITQFTQQSTLLNYTANLGVTLEEIVFSLMRHRWESATCLLVPVPVARCTIGFTITLLAT